MATTNINRRDFLKAGTIAVAAPMIVPSSALGLDNTTAPSERITLGCIGTGGKGRNNLSRFAKFNDVQIVAVCDVDDNHRGAAKKMTDQHYGNQDALEYDDFRDLLTNESIDAVSIATPDHWHALTSIAAANAGKHIYCEKPLANSVGEGRAICDAVENNKVTLQCGSHERSTNSIRYACEQVRNGAIGDLTRIQINLPTDQNHHLQVKQSLEAPAVMPVPEHFDYDFWLGHTPMVPYTEKRCHFWWRFILAYGGGEMTDRGAHIIDIAQLGANADDTGPVEFEATGTRNKSGLFDAFMEFEFVNTYAGGLQMVGSSSGQRGLKFEGTDGWIFIHIHGGKLEASRDDIVANQQSRAQVGDDLGRSPGHHRNFIDCVKSGEQPFATAEIGHRTATICHLNNIAMAVGRPLKWDPVKEEIIGDPEASARLTPKMRAPWSLS